MTLEILSHLSLNPEIASESGNCFLCIRTPSEGGFVFLSAALRSGLAALIHRSSHHLESIAITQAQNLCQASLRGNHADRELRSTFGGRIDLATIIQRQVRKIQGFAAKRTFRFLEFNSGSLCSST